LEYHQKHRPHMHHQHQHQHHQHTVEYFSASYDNSPNKLPHSHNPGHSYLPSKVPSKVPSKFPFPSSSGVSLSNPTFFKPIVVEYKPTTLNHIFKVTTKKPMKIPVRPPIVQDKIPIVQDKIPIVQDKYPTKPGCNCSKGAEIENLLSYCFNYWFDSRMWVETRRFQSGYGERVGASEHYRRAGSSAERVSVGCQASNQR
jgi:hypothetical protein